MKNSWSKPQRWRTIEPGAQESQLFDSLQRRGKEFVTRYRTRRRIAVPPHWHPRDEHITVVHGRFQLGFGRELRPKALRTLHAGDYLCVPARKPHFSVFHPGTEVQVHGLAPFRIVYL